MKTSRSKWPYRRPARSGFASLLLAGGLGASASFAEAPKNCAPVEVAPGYKQVPRGCAGVLQPKAAEKPAAKPTDKSDPHQFKIGDTDVRIGGSVSAQYGTRFRR